LPSEEDYFKFKSITTKLVAIRNSKAHIVAAPTSTPPSSTTKPPKKLAANWEIIEKTAASGSQLMHDRTISLVKLAQGKVTTTKKEKFYAAIYRKLESLLQQQQ
jgi:hypothetical protein